MIFPYETEHYCNTVEGNVVLVSTLWVDIIYTIGAIEKDKLSEDYPPNLENIMEGIGCHDSEVILEFIDDLVSDGFIINSNDCWYLTEKGCEFSPFIK
ncbi:hypothetical protein DSM106972_049150 [Dulcicalothrix desertica PCC 7102]|uniref:Uncharacterized protein n=1 Tax=Dulcicalothrix desertica PCC 7102 TaxID=232991 RepID=A0A3S1CLJ3_9CYAN|nr:hypothetical protein [Dulcicalothrix desertica]RUT04001.1 hypothetical protein DSM106972_049150 [Dulcicalothrix desertica PCC 7102]TWH43594.1 hypothetical protein CAL7102_07330 [Dulcicalothrix desertica PCC 7102]